MSIQILIDDSDIDAIERAALFIEKANAKVQIEDLANLSKSLWSIVATARHTKEVD